MEMAELLIERLTGWMSRSAEQVALSDASRHMTYSMLEQDARAVAAQISARGIGDGQLVAIVGSRCLDIVVGLVAVMFSGAAYTIVEVAALDEDAGTRLEQIGADLVLAVGGYAMPGHGSLAYAFTGSSGTPAPAPLPTGDTGGSTAYVLYTSGSTGTPKGVAVSPRNIAHYCQGVARALGVTHGLRYAHVSTLAADLGNTTLFLALWTGGSLYIADEYERKDPRALYRMLSERQIDVLKITPTHWRTLLDQATAGQGPGPTLGWLVLGGEALAPELARSTLASGTVTRLFNHYGPTETTVGVTVQPVQADQLAALGEASVPIGRALGDSRLLVLDANGRDCPAGTIGELYIGGPQVALGYWRRPDLDAGRFVEHQGHRLYRSGDRVLLDDQGRLHFAGRADRQVKVNGYRVELGHVEAVLQRLLEQRAVVVHRRFAERDYLLCAYEGPPKSSGWLRAGLARQVPGYMLPFSFDNLASLPMNANGKLDRQAVERQLQEGFAATMASTLDEAAPADDPYGKLLGAFRRHCRAATAGVDSDFFDLGGDSLDAVRLISELQLEGFEVTARAFLGNPTLAGLVAQLQHASTPTEVNEDRGDAASQGIAGPAQQWFLQQDMAEPDRWTQSMLVQAEVRLDPERLGQACLQVLQAHEMLRSRFAYDDEQQAWVFEAVAAYPEVFSHLEGEPPEDNLEAWVNRRYGVLESRLSISSGQLFFIELITYHDQQYLLLVAHHLAVDVVSWSLILDELMIRYTSDNRANPLRCASYADWVGHLQAHRDLLARDTAYWQQRLGNPAQQPFAAGTEKDAQTAWITFDGEQTARILAAAARSGVSIDQYLLGQYLAEANRHWPEPVLNVTFESHGRLSLDDQTEVSRTVGWFTAAFPLALASTDLARTPVAAVRQALAAVPHLGHSHGCSGLPQVATRHCFNYLGKASLGLRDDWKLSPAPVTYAGLRGRENPRINQFKLTGRLAGEQLILDLNFNAQATAPALIGEFAQALRCALLDSPAPAGGVYLSTSSSSGALWNIPAPAIGSGAVALPGKAAQNILLTGATGFIGIHVLRELLEQSDATLHCLVRAESAAAARARLASAWSHFFADASALPPERVQVCVGDMSQAGFGLSQAQWDSLASSIDAVYHFAADTRLVGSRSDMQRNIVFPTHELVRFVESGSSKALHFMSTLAVSGCYRGAEPVVFDEDALDVGQDFLNEYERCKFLAEGIVRELAYRGHSAFIYRSGNVTGHSQTAMFQRNANANRWVQCINAIAHAGYAPAQYDEPLVLSPVDIVARGIVSLSLDPSLRSGTYHVDSPYSISSSLFVDSLQDLGIPIKRVRARSLKDALEHSGKTTQAEVALGLFWASREARNLTYDHSRTLSRLMEHRVEFSQLSQDWVLKFVRRLKDLGLFGYARTNG
ncbi:amino acid adenylation domain-containing protein [Pseudomonas sp. L5B5]|uniref:amino acid adenylation domain-containing protein n=1 Tax=Pseudomonas sp. L5B5 TaxID=2883205 RepID=UPI00299E1A63|nr:amino acid adenylation domain-containing protein [Pseudomonas sp. L5B5]